MQNEEIVARIQEGDKGSYAALWGGLRDYVAYCANRVILRQNDACARAGVTVDDLIQSGYLAMYDAARTYREEVGAKFITHFSYHLKRQFNITLGRRTEKQAKDPLNYANSLDEPMENGSGDELCLYDTLVDAAAQDALLAVEERMYNARLRVALEQAVDCLPNTRHREVIRGRYYEGATAASLAERYGCSISLIQQMERDALRNIRCSSSGALLLSFLDADPSEGSYRGTGWSCWEASGISAEERALERKELLGGM